MRVGDLPSPAVGISRSVLESEIFSRLSLPAEAR